MKESEPQKLNQDEQWNKQKQENHLDNLRNFTGFYHGTFFLDGVGQPNLKTHEMKLKTKTLRPSDEH